jgi:hypothetical protein
LIKDEKGVEKSATRCGGGGVYCSASCIVGMRVQDALQITERFVGAGLLANYYFIRLFTIKTASLIRACPD